MADSDGSTVEITVGRVGRAHGLRGDVFVDVRTDEPDRRFAVGTELATGSAHSAIHSGRLVVGATHWHGGRLLVSFEGINDRDAAEALRGTDLVLVVPAAERPDDPEEFYDHQLRGLTAYTPDGRAVGTVVEITHLPGQDLLVLAAGEREILVPFVTELVPSVDVTAGRVELADRPDLLQPDPEPHAEPDDRP